MFCFIFGAKNAFAHELREQKRKSESCQSTCTLLDACCMHATPKVQHARTHCDAVCCRKSSPKAGSMCLWKKKTSHLKCIVLWNCIGKTALCCQVVHCIFECVCVCVSDIAILCECVFVIMWDDKDEAYPHRLTILLVYKIRTKQPKTLEK